MASSDAGNNLNPFIDTFDQLFQCCCTDERGRMKSRLSSAGQTSTAPKLSAKTLSLGINDKPDKLPADEAPEVSFPEDDLLDHELHASKRQLNETALLTKPPSKKVDGMFHYYTQQDYRESDPMNQEIVDQVNLLSQTVKQMREKMAEMENRIGEKEDDIANVRVATQYVEQKLREFEHEFDVDTLKKTGGVKKGLSAARANAQLSKTIPPTQLTSGLLDDHTMGREASGFTTTYGDDFGSSPRAGDNGAAGKTYWGQERKSGTRKSKRVGWF